MMVIRDRSVGVAVAALFCAAAATGTIALVASTAGTDAALSVADATFTAVSALTLTGLTVVDADILGRAAQTIIAALIAVGAVGVTTLVLGALRALGRAGWGSTHALGADLGADNHAQLGRLLGVIAAVTTGAVAAGTVVLRASGLGWFDAGFYALSSFANAGFATLPGSLAPLTVAAVVTVNVLVVVGGFGYVTWFEVRDRLTRRTSVLGVTARMVLVGTVVVLGASAAVLAATEWHNPATLGSLTGGRRLAALASQAIMPRSAGFGLHDSATLTEATKLITTVLMYIGAGPASTGGGIKLTGTAVLVLSVWAAVRGQRQVGTRRWRLGHDTIALAMAVAVVLAVTATTLAVILAHSGASFGDAFFDAMSATTTTGLSTGAIAAAGPAGRWAAVTAMLIGRLGPLLIAVRLAQPDRTVVQPPQRRPLIS
jgi:trk system potassium uptake protein